MPRFLNSRYTLLVAANVVAFGVLGWYQATEAQQKGGQLPFANSNEQRSEIVKELREIKELLREQNTLLKSAGTKDAPAPKR